MNVGDAVALHVVRLWLDRALSASPPPVRDVISLCYHAVSDTWPADLAMPAARMRDQVQKLLNRGYRPVTFTEAMDESATGRLLAVTFDDGFRSVLERGLPVLRELGVPATLYVPSEHIGSPAMAWQGLDRWVGGPHEAELAAMEEPELTQLLDAGWEIGSHTATHPRLTQVGDAQLEAELRRSREALEARLGRPCPSIAYPYGDVDDRVARAARAAGYSNGAGLAGYGGAGDRMQWPRIGVYLPDTPRRFALKVSRLARVTRVAGAKHAVSSALARVRPGA